MAKKSRDSLRQMLLCGALVLPLSCGTGCNHAAAAAPTATTQQQSKEALMNDINDLKLAEQTWVKSLVTGDAQLLATLIDEPFTFIGPDAQFEERAAYLGGYEGMAQAGIAVDSIDLHELKFRVLSDVGIVTGRVVANVKFQGTPLVENVRFTRVYRRTLEGWRMVAGQGTRIVDQAPAGAPAAPPAGPEKKKRSSHAG